MTTQIKDYLSKTYGMEFIKEGGIGYYYREGKTFMKGAFQIYLIKSKSVFFSDHNDTINISYYIKDLRDDNFNYGPESIHEKIIIIGDKTMEQVVEEVEDFILLNGPEWLKRSITINKLLK
jgi:hypothetical protein